MTVQIDYVVIVAVFQLKERAEGADGVNSSNYNQEASEKDEIECMLLGE